MAQDSPTTYFSSDSSRFDQSRSAFDPTQAPTTQDMFSNPAFDPARLHPLAGLGKDEVEYLDIVDAQPSTLEGGRTALPSRGWSDDLCYGTGTTYLSGALRMSGIGMSNVHTNKLISYDRIGGGRNAWRS